MDSNVQRVLHEKQHVYGLHRVYRKILNSPSIFITFNNNRNPNTYSSTRQTGKTHVEIPGQLPVIAGWQDASLMLEDLVEAICIIKLHAPHWFQIQIS